MGSNRARRALVGAGVALALLALAEGAAREWIVHYGNALDVTRAILRVDARLGWRQRANLDTSFLGLPLRTNERGWRAAPVARLRRLQRPTLVLGPSSAFGWGVREADTYAARLGDDVINASEIGYSTDQGVRLYREIIDDGFRPRTVVIAYGVNDVDRHRFYFQSRLPDSLEFSRTHSAFSVGVQRVISSSGLLTVLLKISGTLREWLFHDRVRAAGSGVPPLRVPPNQFRRNLDILIDMAEGQGAQVVLLTSAYALPPASPPLSCRLAAVQADLVGTLQAESGRDDLAKQCFAESVRLEPAQNEVYYDIVALATRAGDFREAERQYDLAVRYEPGRVARDIEAYNRVTRAVAVARGVKLADVALWLKAGNPSVLFVDPIHPSAEGHRRIAEGLLRLLANHDGHGKD